LKGFARWRSIALLLPCTLVAGFLLDSRGGVLFVPSDHAPEHQSVAPSSHVRSVVRSPVSEDRPLGDHYLMLANTALAPLMTHEKLSQFDRSPYDGIAVAFWHAYDTTKVPSSVEINSKITEWKKFTKKDIWPWIYFNRMLGVGETEAVESPGYTKNRYFKRIQGADLDDKAGAMTDFLQFWRNNLRSARDSHAPGVVVDLEFYNFHKEYEVGVLARQAGKSPQETVQLLRQLGSRLADIAAAEYPDAFLWFFFTGFGYPELSVIDNQPYYGSPVYIAMGLLDEIQSKHFHLKVLSGGETTLGYCHDSLQQFQEAIQKRAAKFAPQLEKYQGFFELGGTMTLWRDHAGITGWAKGESCWTSSAATVEDQQPYLELLLKSYRYNWIYAATEVSYFPFQPENAARFNTVINNAKAHVLQASAQQKVH
jgi:hypothetical protein